MCHTKADTGPGCPLWHKPGCVLSLFSGDQQLGGSSGTGVEHHQYSHQLMMIGCLWGDGAWGRKVAAACGPERSSSSFLGLLGAEKVRAGGCPGISVTQDRSQYVSLTSNLTPAKAEVVLQRSGI